MSDNYYVHPSDAYIEREVDGAINRAVLRDEEGTYLHHFPKEWTDEQIMIALDFANNLYAKGFQHGKDRKAGEIRACLGFDDGVQYALERHGLVPRDR